MKNEIRIPLDTLIDDETNEEYYEASANMPNVDLTRCHVTVLHPSEDGLEPAVLIIDVQSRHRRGIVTGPGLLSELQRAEDHFEGTGYVGLGYFLTSWKSKNLPLGVDKRQAALDELLSQGLAEVYDAPDGKEAIRSLVEAHSEE